MTEGVEPKPRLLGLISVPGEDGRYSTDLKQHFRQQSESMVVGSTVWVVGLSGQSIRFSHQLGGTVLQSKIEPGEIDQPLSLSMG